MGFFASDNPLKNNKEIKLNQNSKEYKNFDESNA